MSTREFDPVLSSALRCDLAALAATSRTMRTRTRLGEALRRPQVWATVVTAVILVVATVGVLRLPHREAHPAAPPVADPMLAVTDPTDPDYVGRSVTTLLAATGVGGATRSFEVPGPVSSVRIYFTCTGQPGFTVALDDGGAYSAQRCSRTVEGSLTSGVRPGSRTAAIGVQPGTRWSLLIIEAPSPTASTGGLLDPTAAIGDPENPDAVPDAQVVGRAYDTGDSRASTLQVPAEVRTVRVYLVCARTSTAARVVIDGRTLPGCMNSVAHWTDVRLSARTVGLTVRAPADLRWSLLVIRAPGGTSGTSSAHESILATTGG